MLLAEGYADYLIIPAYGKIREASTLPSLASAQTINSLLNSHIINPNKYIENTHFEVLAAKRFMEQYGLKSAIFVSSPYHMRRIKIISEKIFDDQSSGIDFIPTRFEIAPHHLQHLTIRDWSNIVCEYVKNNMIFDILPASRKSVMINPAKPEPTTIFYTGRQ